MYVFFCALDRDFVLLSCFNLYYCQVFMAVVDPVMAFFCVCVLCSGYMLQHFGGPFSFHFQGWIGSGGCRSDTKKCVGCVAQFEDIKSVTAMEGRKRGQDCPDPMGGKISNKQPIFWASPVGYVAIMWIVTGVKSHLAWWVLGWENKTSCISWQWECYVLGEHLPFCLIRASTDTFWVYCGRLIPAATLGVCQQLIPAITHGLCG